MQSRRVLQKRSDACSLKVLREKGNTAVARLRSVTVAELTVPMLNFRSHACSQVTVCASVRLRSGGLVATPRKMETGEWGSLTRTAVRKYRMRTDRGYAH